MEIHIKMIDSFNRNSHNDDIHLFVLHRASLIDCQFITYTNLEKYSELTSLTLIILKKKPHQIT